MINHINNTKGFSLVEISMVVIIIGLLLGAVLGGTSVMRGARLKVVLKEVKEYESAIKAFEEKYKFYPGDFRFASRYWTAANGDGNWRIDEAESKQAPFHLYLSGDLTREYSGGGTFIIGTNIPPSVIDQGAYWFHSHTSGIYGKDDEAIDVAAYTSGTLITNGLLSVKDAVSIDQKIDDGLADSGYIYGSNGDDFTSATGCVNADPSDNSGSYMLARDGISCRLHFWYDRKK